MVFDRVRRYLKRISEWKQFIRICGISGMFGHVIIIATLQCFTLSNDVFSLRIYIYDQWF